jgi:hypothetical protein
MATLMPSDSHFQSKPDIDTMSAPEDTLASRFNVKGLTNLASYPNPMQKTAQKALARGRTANINRPETPNPFSLLAANKSNEGPGLSLHPARLDPAIAVALPLQPPVARASVRPPPGIDTRGQKNWNHDQNFHTDGSSSHGAPPPLTAGPPGFRQYKPSTFEATIKALQGATATKTGVERPQSPASSEDRIMTSTATSYLPGISFPLAVSHGKPSINPKSASSRHDNRSCYHEHISIAQVESEPCFPNPVSLANHQTSSRLSRRQKVLDTQSVESIKIYYPHGLPSDHTGLYDSSDDDWQARLISKSISTAELLAQRRAAVDKAFYAGVNTLDMNKFALRHMVHHNHVSAVGVIGGERDQSHNNNRDNAAASSAAGATTSETDLMSVNEANRESISIHAEPLMSMAVATLLQYVKDENQEPHNSFCNGNFTKPDQNLIDSTEGGNKSFFEEPKKHKRAGTSYRRGY